jgi:hypothetical protein
MVTVGFVVEGASDKLLIESNLFRSWLHEKCDMKVVDPVVDASGGGNLCNRNIEVFVERLRIQATPDKIVVLADLDPDSCAPCITSRRQIIGSDGIALVVIARKAMESWFLADTEAMRRWTGDDAFVEDHPETMDGLPWDRLKAIGRQPDRRGPGTSKPIFAKRFIRSYGFDVRRAANHPNCPTARYFIDRLCALGAA